jgi:two-component system nitrate/nitrite response regulator NarL
MAERTHRDPDDLGLVLNASFTASPRVYVVSDVRLLRDGLVTSLTQAGDFVVVGAGSQSEALGQLGRLRPDVWLLDVTARDSLALPRQALLVTPELRVVAVAVAEVDAEVLACAEAGFCGYVSKDGSLEDLLDAVHRCVRDELVCSPRIASILFSRLGRVSTTRSIPSGDARLTRREREIAALVASGLQNKEVARRLGISGATIKNHVHNILQKLNFTRRAELVVLRTSLALHYLVLGSYWAIDGAVPIPFAPAI